MTEQRLAPARMNLGAPRIVGATAGATEPERQARPATLWLGVVVMLGALVLAVGVGAAVGSVSVPLSTVVQVIGHHLLGSVVGGGYSPVDEQIVWQLRLPEVLLAVVVGAGLSTVGGTLQATVRNPLADPYLLGVSSGAGFLAAATITLGSGAVGGLSTSGAAFLGAAVSTVLVLVLSAGAGGHFAPTRVVLAGVTLSFLFVGLTNYLIFSSSDPTAANSVLFWLLGSLSNATWSNLALVSVVVALGLGYLMTQGRALNALVVGEETALSVGVNVRTLRVRLLLVTSLVTGVLVAVAGGIAFVGLVIPHAVRLVTGSDHRKVLPLSALAGALFLVLVDLICRVLVRPEVLPVGVVTSVLGAPFFLLLLRSSRAGGATR